MSDTCGLTGCTCRIDATRAPITCVAGPRRITCPIAVFVVDAVNTLTYLPVDEYDLQTGIAAALTAAGLKHEAEFRLNARDRLDFLVEGHVAVEAKVAGSTPDLARQLRRYAADQRVHTIVVVTTRRAHLTVPALIHEVPVTVVPVGGGL